MRKTLIWLILVIVGIGSCTKSSKTDSTNDQTAAAPPDGPCISGKKSEPIADSVAVNYLKRSLRQAELLDLARDNGFGGLVPADSFNVAKVHKRGVLFWFCLSGRGEMFLAMEVLGKYPDNEADLPTYPLSDKLVIANSFKYTGNANQVEDHFNDYFTQPAAGHKWITDSVDTIRTCIDRFMAKYGPQGTTRELVTRAFAYFDEDERPNPTPQFTHITDFYKKVKGKSGNYVRYYFGFKRDGVNSQGQSQPLPNKVRIILVALDCNGQKIHDKNDPGIASLEESWPPPPWN